MAEKELVVLMNGTLLGHVRQASNGNLELTYDENYRNDPSATPLSTAMPLTGHLYRDRSVRPFLVGLLPDNDDVLARWGETFGVSHRNPFALLAHVGEDCAGAAQFVRPERLDKLAEGKIDWLTDADVEDRLRAIRLDPSAWLWGNDEQGQFSLAGAQSKIALYRKAHQWGHPGGRIPTSHILKVASGHFSDQEITDHVTMRAARLAGLAVAGTEIATFGDERAIVVERYDRLFVDGELQRVHQEDICQALSLPPEKKYQRSGGPGPVDIVKLLRSRMPASVVANSIERFVEALVFNWLVGGTDAHAKNYSFLMEGPDIRLAPLYDLTTGLPYSKELLGARDSRIHTDRPLLRMAMSIGGESRLSRERVSNWEAFAKQAGVDAEWIVQQIGDLSEKLPDCVRTATSELSELGVSTFLSELVDLVANHVATLNKSINEQS